jgi:hypothetical protein
MFNLKKIITLACFLLTATYLMADVYVSAFNTGPDGNYPNTSIVSVEAYEPEGVKTVSVWVYDVYEQLWYLAVYTQYASVNRRSTTWNRFTLDLPSPCWLFAQSNSSTPLWFYKD